MPRLTPIDPGQAEGKAKALLDGVQKALGTTPKLLRTLAHSPAALQAYLDLGKALGGGSLSAEAREAIALTVAGENGCDYCASAHTAIGRHLGVAASELAENLEGRSGDPKLAAILRFARALVVKRGWVSDAMAKIAELQEAGSWNIADISPIGVLGDPTRASAEAGHEILAALVPVYAQVVREALES